MKNAASTANAVTLTNATANSTASAVCASDDLQDVRERIVALLDEFWESPDRREAPGESAGGREKTTAGI
jgi:hypothetical protein